MKKPNSPITKVKDGVYIISNRSSITITEVLVFPLISFLALGIFFNWLVGLIVGALNLLLYPLVRFSSWIFYKELYIKGEDFYEISKFLNKSYSTRLITANFEKKNLKIITSQRGGKTKYTLKYQTHKLNDLMIFENEIDISSINITK